MEFSDAALKFMRKHLLNVGQSPESFFRSIASEAAYRDKKIEPGSDLKEIEDRFFQLFADKLFFPSYQWLCFFGPHQNGKTLDTPLDYVGGPHAIRTSLRDSEVLRYLDLKVPYLVDVPPSFVNGLERQVPWQIQYRNEPFTSGEVPSQSLWEALSHQIKTLGYPALHFPEAIRPAAQLDNPPGPMVRGSLNLAKMVRYHKGEPSVNWNLMVETVVEVVRFMDAMVEIAEEQRQDGYIRELRRIGLGIMGFAEFLLQLKIPYNSQQAVQMAGRIASFVQTAMQEATAALSQYRPVVVGAQVHVRGFTESVRNLSRLYVLPEMELALLANTSPGIDPMPALAGRWVGFAGSESPFVINSILMKQLEAKNWLTERVMDELLDTGSLSSQSGLPEDFLDLYATREEVGASAVEYLSEAMQQVADDLIVSRIWMTEHEAPDFLHRRLVHAVYRKLRTLWIVPSNSPGSRYFKAGSAPS